MGSWWAIKFSIETTTSTALVIAPPHAPDCYTGHLGPNEDGPLKTVEAFAGLPLLSEA